MHSGQRVAAAWSNRFPHLAGDFRGGLASAIVGLPYAVTAAMLAVAPLGPAYVGHGMLAGLVSALIAGLIPLSGTPFQISGPRASIAVLMAGIVAAAMAHPALADVAGGAHGPRVLGIVMLCLIMAGVLQVAFGALGVGNALRFLPYPVISGFMVGLGILVAAPQVPAMLGMQGVTDWSALQGVAAIAPGALLAGLLTIATFVGVRKRIPRWPAPVAAIAAGTVLHYALKGTGLLAVGQVPWDLIDGFPALPWHVPQVAVDSTALSVLIALFPATLTLAFVASLETLLSASVLSIASNRRYDGRRELIGQGITNVAIAAAGGVASCGAPFRGVINYGAGGRTRLSGAINGLLIGGVGLAAAPLLFWLPLSVWAGVLVVVGWDVAYAWARRLAGNPRADILVGILVLLVTLGLGTVPAIAVGIAGSMFLYVRNTSRAPVRGVYDGRSRSSSRVRPAAQRAFLGEHGGEVRVVELQGALFFGTADHCGHEIEKLAAGCKQLVLDLRRVGEVDTTGALVLMQTASRLKDGGMRVSLAGVAPGGRRGEVLRLAGLTRVVPESAWFADADGGLEDAENRILERRWPDHREAEELALRQMDLCARLSPDEIAALAKCVRRERHPAGTVLFTEGAAGDCLYFIAKGAVILRVSLAGEETRARRLSTYSAGLVFGEMAVLEGKPRSAEAVCEGETVLYVLQRAQLERMARDMPSLYGALLLSLSLHLASRLRTITAELSAALE